METRRFDELAVAAARGGSRRGVLRGLVGGVLGALALDRTGRTAPIAARPVANGCSHAGRTCEGPGGTGTCCGSKLTCTVAEDLSSSCTNTPRNNKCCFPVGTSCQGHCECCLTPEGGDTKCKKGTCSAV
jgi:hypothetical protein